MDTRTARVSAAAIVARLRAHGHSAYLAGGCVRDLLLGAPPTDYDVATSARPEAILGLFPHSIAVGAHFGVHLIDGVEVAAYRSDIGSRDGRRPEQVIYETDPRQDVLRRDFTINSMLMDPETGEVIDHAGGRADLAARLIRTVGDPRRRFAEDYLRMLRAVRFAARLSFEMDGAAVSAIRALAPNIHRISAERIREELNRVLTEGGARRGFELLDGTGLLAEVLPEVRAMKGVEQPPEFHPEGGVWTHVMLMLEMLERPTVTLAWGALLHDVGKPSTFRVAERIRFDGHVEAGAQLAARILVRLRFSHDEIRQIESLVVHHLRFKDAPAMKESTLKRFLRLDRFEEHLELHRMDCLSSHGNLANYEFVRRKLNEFPPEAIRPPRLVTGADLIVAGYTPGPGFRPILEAVETAQLEGKLESREQALAWVRAAFEPPDGLPVTRIRDRT